MMQTSLKKTLTSGFMTLVLVAVAACTKSRNNEVADEATDAQLVSMAELNAENYQMSLGADAEAADFKGKPLAVNEKPTFKSRSVSAPNKIAPLLRGLPVVGKSNETFALKFKVTPTLVFIMKRVDDVKSLSAIEASLTEDVRGMKYLPIYTIPVLGLGKLVNQRTDTGERSYKQDFRETSLAEATHAKLDLREEKVIAVEIPRDQANYQTRREIFRGQDLNKKVMTVSAFNDLAQTELGLPDANAKIYTQVMLPADPASNKVSIYVYSIRKKSSINDPQILSKLNSKIPNSEVLACTDEAKQQSANGDDCIMILERSLAGSTAKTTLARGESGYPTSAVTLEDVPAAQSLDLIRIVKNTTPTETGPEKLRSFNPINTIAIADIKGKEFLFRRTFEDGSSAITSFGPGGSGAMDIVKFVLEEDRLVVKRVDSVNANAKATDIDKEELMSIPAAYYNTKDDTGATLNSPRKATVFTADLVVLDWTRNRLESINSPMSFFDNGQCFLQTADATVVDMDQRLSVDKVMSFTIAGSYTFQPGCVSYFGMNDYWYGTGIQTNFNMKERLSFRVHNPEDDKEVNQDLPFRAQHLMNFGIFTMGKRVADKFGNFGREENEKGLPVIQNFKNGKTLTYHLGGLPADAAYKQLFIKTTRQVVADWNETLHRAFKNTDLDRSGDYIILKIDGIDATYGHLGDLDRNYIWNFDKNMDSGLLGLSQSAPNPRTGFSLANNVLMYSGNLLSYIGSQKQNALILRDYDEMKKQVLAKMQKEFDAEQKGAAPQPLASTENGGSAQIEESKETAGLKNGLAHSLIRRLTDVAGKGLQPRTPVALLNPTSMQKIAQQIKSIRTGNEDIAGMKNRFMENEQARSPRAYLYTIVKKALEMNAVKDEGMLSALSATEILKAYGNQLSADERQALSIQSRRLALAADFKKNFSKLPGCIMSVDGIPNLSGKSMADASVEDLFSNWYASTLSHEMGHSLGLTHNFQGSYDKKNFRFKDEGEKEVRPYSTVMDYSNSFDENYRKPGPYDVHAIRAGYTGKIELDNDFLEALKKQGKDGTEGKTITVGAKDSDDPKKVVPLEISNGMVRLAQLKEIMVPSTVTTEGTRAKSWWSLQGDGLKKIPLKHFYFCTDVDAGGEPTCNRWDDGTSPIEIVRSYIRQYNEIYPVMNTRGNKIALSDMNRYYGRVIGNMLAIRGFLDETFFRAIRGGYSDVGEYAQATFEGYKFLLNVYNTPEVQAQVMDPSRFIRVDYNKAVVKKGADGKPIVDKDGEPVTEPMKTFAMAEGRSMSDFLTSGFDDGSQLALRGIEMDKALAIQLLTLRGTGNFRYARYGLSLSYAEFEKFMMQLPASNSLMLRALRQTFSDNMTSMLFVDGGLAEVDAAYAPDTTDLLHYYSIISASVMLESNTLEDKDNFAALFRVGSTFNATPPAGALLVSKMDSQTNDSTALKYWSVSNAIYSADMVREAAQKRIVIENLEPLAAAMLKMAQSDEAGMPAALSEMVALVNKLNVGGVLINDAEAKAGVTAEKAIRTMFQLLSQHIALFNSIAADMQKQGIKAEQVTPELVAQFSGLKKTFEANAKASPLALVVSEVIRKMVAGDQAMTALAEGIEVSTDTIKTNYGVLMGNIQTLNKIGSQLNPELNR